MFYKAGSDPKLIKDSEKAYLKVLKALKKDKSILEVFEEVEII